MGSEYARGRTRIAEPVVEFRVNEEFIVVVVRLLPSSIPFYRNNPCFHFSETR
jgi:hypothetical protein